MSAEDQTILVIGAGLPRTGTKSLSQALEILLGGPCLHGSQLPKFKNRDFDFWLTALNRKCSPEEWRNYLKMKKACLDYPCVLFYKDLMEAYPDAKVVATVRDPDKWYDSWWSSIGLTLEAIDTQPIKWVIECMEHPKTRTVHETARSLVPSGCEYSLDEAFKSRERSRKFYNDWMAEVERCVPKDRLLILDIRQGWKPLCDFLGLPVPDVPFPHVNESREIQESIHKMKIISWALTISIPTVVSAVAYLAWKKIK